MKPGLDPDFCWQAVTARDARQDGSFIYGVITTGVYCRPGCPARTPKRENVRFYSTAADAERDGLRPCSRCRPAASQDLDPIRIVCRYIEEHADDPLTLADLGRVANLSPYHLQRRFKAVVGVSARQYQENCRIVKLKSVLRTRSETGVTGAIFEAGFGSLSRVYEKTDTRLGMTPMEYRAGGRGVQITYAVSQTPLGLMMVGATDRGLCFVQFGDEEASLLRALAAEYPAAEVAPMPAPPPPAFLEWMDALNSYLEGQRADLRLPLHVRATAFQLRVWTYLQTIPPGSVQSYSEVASGIGEPRAVRAVARACASNHVALAIPCHRVIRGTGELGGYRWGLERKRVLIDRERSVLSTINAHQGRERGRVPRKGAGAGEVDA